jgi:alkanesulfonate monooxygenase
VTFRPIIAETDELAWAKADRYVSLLEKTYASFPQGFARRWGKKPENVGSQRLLSFAEDEFKFDRALYTKTAAVTGAAGASTALVGSPETVAAAILDYVDIGADLISIRGYDTLNDVIDYGRYVLPLVRQELAHREATGQRGTLQADNPGLLLKDKDLVAA